MFALKDLCKSMMKKLFRSQSPELTRGPRSGKLQVECLENRDLLATLLWQGLQSNLWDIKGNWIDTATGQPANAAPVPTDTVLFTAASTTNCTVDVQALVASLQIDGYTKTITLSKNKSLTVNGGFLKTLTPNNDFATIKGAGDFTIASGATFTWNRGTMAGGGTTGVGKTVVSSGATLNIASDIVGQMDARLAGRELLIDTFVVPIFGTHVDGSVNFTSGQLFCQTDPINNTQKAIITNKGIFAISGTAAGIVGGPATFTNQNGGKVTVNLNSSISSFAMLPTFDNKSKPQGAFGVDVTSGQLQLSGGGTSSGTWAVTNDQVISFLQNVSTDPVPQFAWNSGTQFFGGNNGNVYVIGADITVSGKIPIVPIMNIRSGRVIASLGTLDIQNSLKWSGGSTVGTGTIQVDDGATLAIFRNPTIASVPVLNGWAIANSGFITLGKYSATPAVASVNFQMGNGATITNKAIGTTITILDNSNVFRIPNLELGKLDVGKGTLNKPIDSGTSQIQAHILGANAANINVYTNSLLQFVGADGVVYFEYNPTPGKKLSQNGSFNFDSLPTVWADGSLVGDGTITTATFANAGKVLPGDVGNVGQLTFNSNYTQLGSGVLKMDLGGGSGAVGGTDYDQIVIGNGGYQVTLAGTLDLDKLSTLAPVAGDVYRLIDNRSSSPITTTFAGLPEGARVKVGGNYFIISYKGANPNDSNNNDVILTSATSSISGLVWQDTNRDGIRQPGPLGEPLRSGVVVNLTDTLGNTITTTTNANGKYSFVGLGAGLYTVTVAPPDHLTQPGVGDPIFNSDFIQSSRSVVVPLGTDQHVTHIDAGFWVNSLPVAVNDTTTLNQDATATSIPVLANDTDQDGDTLLVTAVTQGANGGTVAITGGGTNVSYTPAPGFVGTDTFTYTISDGYGGTASATVTVTVNPVNQLPVAINDFFSTLQNTALSVDPRTNDSDPDGDTLTISSVTASVNGGTVVITGGGTGVNYTPAAGFTGTDSFDYTISDGHGGTASATVAVTVNPSNQSPIAVGDSTSTNQDTPTNVNVLANDSDPDGDTITISSVTQGANGGVVAITGGGTGITYTPASGFVGSDSFTYTISDGHGGTATATVMVTVNAVNHLPVAVADSASTLQNTPVNINVLANDSDPDGDTLTIISVTSGVNGGTVAITGGGTGLAYAPAPGFVGTDSFVYTISDGHGGTASATVNVNVTPSTGSIGDFVWLDTNGDGKQTPGESGLGGITVKLTGGTGTLTQVTDSTGHYQFTNLSAGNYQVQFIVPFGYTPTQTKVGSDDSIDSDALPSGFTNTISLAAGQTNLNIDAGLIYIGSGSGSGVS